MLNVETARHQVAIAGRVTDAVTGKPITGAQVCITEAQDPFAKQLVTRAKNVRFGVPALDVVRPLTQELSMLADLVRNDQAYPSEAQNVAKAILEAIKDNRLPVASDVRKVAKAILDNSANVEKDVLYAAKTILTTPTAVLNVNAARAIMDTPGATPEERLAAAQVLLDGLQARQTATLKRPDQTFSGLDGSYFFMDLPNGIYTLAASLPEAGSRYEATKTASATVSRDGTGKINIASADMSLQPTGLEGKVLEERLFSIDPASATELNDLDNEKLPSSIEVGLAKFVTSDPEHPVVLKVKVVSAGTEWKITAAVGDEYLVRRQDNALNVYDNRPIMAEVRVVGSGESTFSSAGGMNDGQYHLVGLEHGDRILHVSARGYQTTPKKVSLQRGHMTHKDIQLKRQNGP